LLIGCDLGRHFLQDDVKAWLTAVFAARSFAFYSTALIVLTFCIVSDVPIQFRKL